MVRDFRYAPFGSVVVFLECSYTPGTEQSHGAYAGGKQVCLTALCHDGLSRHTVFYHLAHHFHSFDGLRIIHSGFGVILADDISAVAVKNSWFLSVFSAIPY